MEWKKWWNPVDAQQKLVSLTWTEDIVEEMWVKTGDHDNPWCSSACGSMGNDDGKTKGHNKIKGHNTGKDGADMGD